MPAFSRRAIALLALLLLAGCDRPNPILGRWSAEGPAPGFTIGNCEFADHHMSGFGLDQDVDYEIFEKQVRVIPRQFGPHLDITLIDDNTARVSTPLTGSIVTLHRIRG
jgi:hypothetical protein